MSEIVDITDFEKASSGTVIRMKPLTNDNHPFYAAYEPLTIAVHALASRAPLHLSGHSGTGKSHFLNCLLFGPRDNMLNVASCLDLPLWPAIKIHRLFIASYETPAEVWYRTEVVDFSTKERPQPLLDILSDADGDSETLHVIWLVESGRGINASVQSAFLEVVGQRIIREPRGRVLDASNVTFVTDSNHVSNEAGEFAIWDLDQAYGRRWTCRLRFDGLSIEEKVLVLRELCPEAADKQIQQVAVLSMQIQERQREGSLQSILPPTIDVELHLLSCMRRLPVDLRELVFTTILGHCANRDLEEAENVFAEAFGIRVKPDTPAAEAVGVL